MFWVENQACTFEESGTKKRFREKEGFYKAVIIAFLILLFIWGLYEGLVLLGISFYEAHGLGAFLLVTLVLFSIPAIAGFYVIYRFFKGTPWTASNMYYTACSFQGLGDKREAYLDQLTKAVVDNNCKVFEKSTLGWMEGIVIGGADLLFESSNKLSVTGVRVKPANGDLRVGFASLGGKRVFPILFLFLFLAIFAVFIPTSILGWSKIAVIMMLSIFFAFLCAPLVFMAAHRRVYDRSNRHLLVALAESMGSKQINAFQRTTVKLESY